MGLDAELVQPPERVPAALPAATDDERFVGVATRVVSWVVDAVLINLASILAGAGTALVLSLFPLSADLKPALTAVAGVVYVLWAAAYFVVFWSTTGQTPGARVMQIRLLSASRERVGPKRALIRWIGMNLAMIPLFAGYLPILFRRRGFPDWLAHTLVVEASDVSWAQARRSSIKPTSRGGGRSVPALPQSPPGAPSSSPPGGPSSSPPGALSSSPPGAPSSGDGQPAESVQGVSG